MNWASDWCGVTTLTDRFDKQLFVHTGMLAMQASFQLEIFFSAFDEQ